MRIKPVFSTQPNLGPEITCQCPHWSLSQYPVCVCVCVCVWSHFILIQLFVTLWTVAHQAPLSIKFSRQEHWRDGHALLQGILLTQESNPHLLCLLHRQVGSLPLAPPGKPYSGLNRIRSVIKCSRSVVLPQRQSSERQLSTSPGLVR